MKWRLVRKPRLAQLGIRLAYILDESVVSTTNELQPFSRSLNRRTSSRPAATGCEYAALSRWISSALRNTAVGYRTRKTCRAKVVFPEPFAPAIRIASSVVWCILDTSLAHHEPIANAAVRCPRSAPSNDAG